MQTPQGLYEKTEWKNRLKEDPNLSANQWYIFQLIEEQLTRKIFVEADGATETYEPNYIYEFDGNKVTLKEADFKEFDFWIELDGTKLSGHFQMGMISYGFEDGDFSQLFGLIAAFNTTVEDSISREYSNFVNEGNGNEPIDCHTEINPDDSGFSEEYRSIRLNLFKKGYTLKYEVQNEIRS